MNTQERVLENRLRRMAYRLGLQVIKNRNRIGNVGGYMIVEPNSNVVVDGGSPVEFSLDLNDLVPSLKKLAKMVEGWRTIQGVR
jgi:hypothetical protein